MILLLILSLVVGAMIGEMFFKLFVQTVPPMAVSAFNQGAAHAMFVTYGLVVGGLLFVWALLTAFLARRFHARPRASKERTGTPAV